MQIAATPLKQSEISLLHAWVLAERGRFALWLPVAMAVGVVWYFALLEEPKLWLGLAGTALALAASMLLRGWLVPRALAHLTVALGLGFASAQFATWRAAPVMEVPKKATIVSGTVVAVEVLPTGRRVLLKDARFDDGPALPRLVRTKLKPADKAEIGAGDTLRVRAMLSRPSPPAYPGGWDLQRDAFFAGIGAFGFALNPSVVVTSGPGGWLQSLRETIAARIRGSLAGSPGEIAVTLLTGTAVGIPAADRSAFRDSGLAHLLAIAGLHIGIVMGLVFGTVRFGLAAWERAALHWPVKAISAVSALAAGLAYLLLTGAHVPIIRSFAMACLVTLGVLVGRRALSLRGLALAMAAVVVIAPNEVMGVSFQMSFSAVLALIVGYAALQPWLAVLHGDGSWRRRFGGHVAALALTSALAGTFSAPYAAYHFGHVQIYYVIANMVAVPITAMLAMPAGLVALALMPLHLEFLALAPMGWGIDAILWVARAVSSLPDATFAVPHAPAWGLGVFSLGLAWAGLWRTRLRFAGVAAMALGLASPMFETPPDILVSSDARLIALRQDGLMHVLKTNGGSGFVQDSWQQYWAMPAPVALECPGNACSLRPHAGVAALLVRDAEDRELCQAAVLVSPEPIRLHCPDFVPWVDRFSVWRNGSYAIWLGADGVKIVSDSELRGTRPWVLGVRLAGAFPAGTKPALIEVLPNE